MPSLVFARPFSIQSPSTSTASCMELFEGIFKAPQEISNVRGESACVRRIGDNYIASINKDYYLFSIVFDSIEEASIVEKALSCLVTTVEKTLDFEMNETLNEAVFRNYHWLPIIVEEMFMDYKDHGKVIEFNGANLYNKVKLKEEYEIENQIGIFDALRVAKSRFWGSD